MKNKTILILTGIIIIITGIFFSLHYQPESLQDNPVNPAEENLEPGDQFKNVQLVFFNSDGSISWHLDSESINNLTRQRVLELFPVNITAITEGEEVLYNLHAHNSYYNLDSGLIQIAGPIEIIKDQLSFQAANISWQDGGDFLLATGGIYIHSPDFIIEGESLESDLSLNRVTIKGSTEKQAYFTWKDGSDQDKDL
ncbi:MAG: LPS export ABC transporter periplasmic protein LptC [Halanaerobiales bacterium]